MSSDTYRPIRVTFRDLREKSVWVDKPPSRGRGQVSIARSLIHGGDEAKLARLFAGETVEIRIFAWKAEEMGFA